MLFGFGVHPATLDPTLLKIKYPFYGQGSWYVLVFTLSSRTWYKLESYCLPCKSIRIKRSGQAVVGGKIFWVGLEIYSDDGISYKIYILVSFDLITHQFHVINMPEQMLVGEFLPPYFISQLEDSIIVSGSFSFGNFRIIYAWELEVDDGEVSSYKQLFTISYPAEHELKLIGFSKDKQPIVEDAIFQQWHQSLQVFNPSIQSFQNGFGVRPDTLDPTIINISMPFYGHGPWHVLLYTLNSDTWRVLGNDRLPRIGIRIKRSWGIAVVGNHIDNDENRYICAWLLEVEAAFVTSWKVIFVMPSQNIVKLIGFTMDDDPIVVVDMGHEIVHTLQVYDRPSQQFHTLRIVGTCQLNVYILSLNCLIYKPAHHLIILSHILLEVLSLMDANFNNETDPWEFGLDIDDSDLHLTPSLHSSNSEHIESSTLIQNPVTIIPGPTGLVQLFSNIRAEPYPSTPNPVRIIPDSAGIVQQAKLLKENVFILDLDGALMSTQKYMQKIIEDVYKDDDFNSGVWVSATNYVMVFGGTVTGCLGDINNFLKKGKLDHIVAIIKSGSSNMLGDLNVTLKDISEHYLNITMRNVVEVFRKDTVLGSGTG
nr:hypothetical protein [Tanacetum cinerariifolium]